MAGFPAALVSIVGAIALWGLWGFWGKIALQRGMSPTSIFLAEVVAGLAIGATVVIAQYLSSNAVESTSGWNLYGVLSGGAMAGGLLCFYFALQSQKIAIVVPLTAIYPAVAVVLGVMILGESPNVFQWLGLVLVVIGSGLLLG